MHFGIDGQAGGFVGFLILAGAIGLIAVIVFTLVAQFATESNDGPPETRHTDDEDEVPL
jgi:hypothetical protein